MRPGTNSGLLFESLVLTAHVIDEARPRRSCSPANLPEQFFLDKAIISCYDKV